MIVCPACGYNNIPGTLYCEDCAEALHNASSLPHDVLQKYLDNLSDDRAWGILEAERSFWLILQPETFYQQRRRLIKGRLGLGRLESSDDFTTIKLDSPDIEKLGVSRLHAALVPLEHGVGLQDVSSTNGTRLNGQRLASGRIYNVTDRDRIELGKFILKVYFLDKIKFLRAIRKSLVKEFSQNVQTLLNEIDVPTDALGVLQERLPGMTTEQVQVLSLFKERNEPVTLEHLHKRINKVIGELGIPTRPDILYGENTKVLGNASPPARQGEKSKTAIDAAAPGQDTTKPGSKLNDRLKPPADGASPTKTQVVNLEAKPDSIAKAPENDTSPAIAVDVAIEAKLDGKPKASQKDASGLSGVSEQSVNMLGRLHTDGVKMEARLREYLAEAERLPTEAERQEVINLITPILIQMNTWLPTIAPAKVSSD